MKLWQNRITSLSDFPLGSKSDPPLPPPIARVVRAFLKTCSKARNFRILRVTDGWNRRPPLYGPIALFIPILYPRFTCTCPWSSIQGTRNIITRSGSVILSKIAAWRYSGFRSSTDWTLSKTSFTAWWNSFSPGSLSFITLKMSDIYITSDLIDYYRLNIENNKYLCKR